MTIEGTPVHLAGVRTGQSRGSYLMGVLFIVVTVLLIVVAAAVVLGWIQKGSSSHPYMVAYGALLGTALTIPILALAVRLLHGQTLGDLIAPGRRPDGGMVVRAALVFALPQLVQVAIGLWMGDLRLSETSLWLFALLAPVSILLFTCQASVEELLFRGYLAQAGQVWFRHALPASLLTAVLFTLAHEGTDMKAVWAMRMEIFSMALFMSWVTVRLGRLEAAMGVHIINNVLFSFFIGSPDMSFPDLTVRVDLDPPDLSGWAEWGEFAFYQLMSVLFFWLVGMKTGFIEKGWIRRRAA